MLALYKTQSVIVSRVGILNVCVCKLETGESKRFNSRVSIITILLTFFFSLFLYEIVRIVIKKYIYIKLEEYLSILAIYIYFSSFLLDCE